MSYLAGGYHLPLAHKVAISNAAFIHMTHELMDDEEGWRDNVADSAAIITFAGTMYALWIPPAVQASIAARVGILLAPLALPAAIATSAYITGGFISAVIDPEEGLENYREFFAEPTKIPEKVKFTAETIYAKKIDPAVQTTLGITAMVYDIAEQEVIRKANQIYTGAEEFVDWLGDHRFVTGPYLPF